MLPYPFPRGTRHIQMLEWTDLVQYGLRGRVVNWGQIRPRIG